MEFEFDYFEIPSNTIVLAKKRFPTVLGVAHPTPQHYYDINFVYGADFGRYGGGEIAKAWNAIQGRNYSGVAYTAFAAKLAAYNQQCIHCLAKYAALQFAAEADKELASIIAGMFGTPVIPKDIWELLDEWLEMFAERYRHIYGIMPHEFHIKCKTLDEINNYGLIKDHAIPGIGGYYRHDRTYYTDRELKDSGIYIPKSEGFMNCNYAEATLRRLDDVYTVYYGRELEKLETDEELHEVYDYQDGTKHLDGIKKYWEKKDFEQVYRDFLYGTSADDDEDEDEPYVYDDYDIEDDDDDAI